MGGLRDAFRRRFAAGDLEQRRTELEKRKDEDPLAYALGMANLSAAQGRPEEALVHAKQAHALRPEDPRVLRAMAYCHLINGEHEAATRYAREACEKDSSLASLGMLANLLLDTGRYADAEAAYRRMLEQAPRSAQAFNGIATARYRQGDRQGALEYYARAFEADPEDGTPIRSITTVLAELGWHLGAFAMAEVLESSSAPPEVRAALSLVRLDLSKAVSAGVPAHLVPDMDRLAGSVVEAVKQRSTSVRLRAARSLFDAGRTGETEAILEAIDPEGLDDSERANFLYIQGLLADRAGNQRAALEAFAESVRLDGRRWDACCNAVHLLLANEDDRSLALAGELLDRVPAPIRADAAPLLFNEGLYLKRTGRREAARSKLERVLQLSSEDEDLATLARQALLEL